MEYNELLALLNPQTQNTVDSFCSTWKEGGMAANGGGRLPGGLLL